MRKIAVFTGTRADYGLLYWLMREIESNAKLRLQIIVSGSHLSPAYGNTWQQIVADGFNIDARVDMQLDGDGPVSIAKSMGVGLIGIAEALDDLTPDILVVLGDRYEALAAAQAAMIAGVPLAHIHGGEATEGLIDEAVRHSITKMSHLHFVAAEPFRRRVVQLGEDPERVWVVGAAGLDNVAKLKKLELAELSDLTGISFRYPLFLMTYHPVTLEKDSGELGISMLLEAVAKYAGTIVITGVNADTGSSKLRERIRRFSTDRPGQVAVVENLGTQRYLSLMAHADVVIGNSSSGLLEAPAMGVPTVDIGDRQSGRPFAPSVLHAVEDLAEIESMIMKALSCEHKKCAQRRETPYGGPGAAERICNVLATYPLSGILKKKFFDIEYSREI